MCPWTPDLAIRFPPVWGHPADQERATSLHLQPKSQIRLYVSYCTYLRRKPSLWGFTLLRRIKQCTQAQLGPSTTNAGCPMQQTNNYLSLSNANHNSKVVSGVQTQKDGNHTGQPTEAPRTQFGSQPHVLPHNYKGCYKPETRNRLYMKMWDDCNHNWTVSGGKPNSGWFLYWNGLMHGPIGYPFHPIWSHRRVQTKKRSYLRPMVQAPIQIFVSPFWWIVSIL